MTEVVSNRHVIMRPTPIIWAHLIKPRPARTVQGNTFKSQYGVAYLFAPDAPDFLAIKELAGQVAMAKFGRTNNLGYKFLESGDRLADEAKANGKDKEFLRGKVLFQPHSGVAKLDGSLARPPKLIVINNGKYHEYEDEAERPAAGGFFYNGCLCRGEITLSPYTGMGGGVTAYLNEIVSLNSGPKIAAGSSDAESKYGSVASMAQYMGTVSSVNPMQGMDADIPF